MKRKVLFEWLDTHPTNEWVIVHDDEGHIRVLFWFDEEHDDE